MERKRNYTKSRGGTESQSVSVRNRREAQTHMEEDEASGVTPCNGTTRTPAIQTSALDVSHASQQATTKAGKLRQRMAWDDDMNRHVMRCYYKATHLETIKTGSRFALHTLFTEKYPHLKHLTEQRLLDQKRVIVNNKILSPEELQKLKEEIAVELNEPFTSLQNTPSQTTANNTQETLHNDQLQTTNHKRKHETA